MARVILHCDMNSFFASVELLSRPELRDAPVAVCGDPASRHGVILAKNEAAKKFGIVTAETIWQARKKCPELVLLPPHHHLYREYSRKVNAIYDQYTDLVEPFSVDESWLDVTDSCSLKGDGMTIAAEISRRIKFELGITVSIGVSWNKIFAKLGSDYKKPDAITEISKQNYRHIVWPLPAEDLLFVGPATKRKLRDYGIRTIGHLAEADPGILSRRLGKMAYILHAFANGEDQTPVSRENTSAPIKSIGNSTTTPRDLVNESDVAIVVYLLAESVAARLRDNHFKGDVVEISVRDKDLYSFTRQHKISMPTNITSEIAAVAMKLFRESYKWEKPIRSMGVRVSDLVLEDCPIQLDLFISQEQREKQHRVDVAVDTIRRRFGFYAIQRGLMYTDRKLAALNAKEDNVVHPHGYMERGDRTGAYAG